MILVTQFTGTVFGLLAVVLGAFGAHLLREKLDARQMESFGTGVRYQMYHGLLLIVLGFNLGFDSVLEVYMIYAFILGTILFSFSIYLLVLGKVKGWNVSFLGPVTPVGGLLLILGWVLLLYRFSNHLF